MAQWQTASLQGISAVTAAAQGVVTATGVATTFTTGMAAAVTGLTGFVPSALSLAAVGQELLINAGVEMVTNTLDLGCYMCLAYPRDLDFNYGNLMNSYVDGVKSIQQNYGLSRDEVMRVFGQRNEVNGLPVLDDGEIWTRLLAALPAFPSSPFQNAASSARGSIDTAFDALVTELNEKKRKLYFSRWPRRTIYSFNDWVNHIDESMDDTGDPRRPQFTLGSITMGGALVVGADDINEFVTRIQSLASLIGNKKLSRFASAGANALGARATSTATSRRGYNKFPDWSSVSVADAVGLKGVRNDMKRGVSAMLGARTTSAVAAATAYASRISSTVSSITTGINDVAALVNAALNADIGASVLFIPPEDGHDTVAIANQTFTVPKGTYGNEGFIYALRNATNAPTWNYVAGFVFMVGFPIPGFEAALQALNVTSGTAPSAAIARYLSQSGAGTSIDQFVNAVNGVQNTHSQTFNAFKRLLA